MTEIIRSKVAKCGRGAVVAVAVLIGTGCGGGGSAPVVPSTRLIQVGDRLTYRVSGQATEPGGAPADIRGNAVQTVETRSIALSNVNALVMSGEVTFGTVLLTLASATLFSQDPATRILSFLGDDLTDTGDPRLVTANSTLLPGAWSSANGYDVTNTFSDGSSQAHRFTIVGKETITVPAGTFEAWKVRETTTDGGVTANSTNWYAPEVGWYVKSDTTTVMAGTTFHFVFLLESTSFATRL